MKINFKRYSLYLVRWQLSTPILAICLVGLDFLNSFWATVVANFIGGLIFFWVDRFIFRSKILNASWQVEERVSCFDCGDIARGYRLVRALNYDREESVPEFRCEKCSIQKSKELRNRGLEH